MKRKKPSGEEGEENEVEEKRAKNEEQNHEVLRIVMVGKTGIGKSATGNTILGRQCFESKFSAKSMTVDCSKGKALVHGQQVAVIDTPGLFDTRFGMDKTTKDICQCISYAAPGPHVFLVVIRLGRYTEEEKQTVQRIQEIFGQAADRYSMVLFTHGDLLEDTTIEGFLDGSPDLQELISRCNGQYHVFNNKLKDGAQVTELIQKIRNIVQKNGGSHYTNEMFQEAERAIEEEKQRILKEKEEQIRKEQEELERKLQKKYEKEMKKMNAQLQAERERERKEREEERKREKEEMNEERKREREEREAERKREREEKEREMTNMMNKLKEQHDREVKERKNNIRRQKELQKKHEKEMKDVNAQFQAERERERKEREEERKREKEMNEERKREEREAERKREIEEKEREINRIKEQLDREHEERKNNMRAQNELQKQNYQQVRELIAQFQAERHADRKIECFEKTMNMMMMTKLNENRYRELQEERKMLQLRYENEAREEAEGFNPLYPLVKAGEAVVGAGKKIVGGVKHLGRAIGSLFKF